MKPSLRSIRQSIKLKDKICKNPTCRKRFTPVRPLQAVCSTKCGLDWVKMLAEKKERQEWNKRKKVLKEKSLTHKDYLKLLQTVFNTFIRLRDSKLPCVSCGVYDCEEFHAGHFIATTYQALRFNEDNVWRQCSKCNTHLRGNLIPYRIELIKRIGLKRVEKLESLRHNTMKLSIPEIKELITVYRNKIKLLKTN